MSQAKESDDSQWERFPDLGEFPQAEWARHWFVPEGVTYLNHGSFGLTPLPVRKAVREWQDRLHDQPMNFYTREYEPAWFQARKALADFVGANEDGLVFTENATAGMNIVARSLRFEPGDEILLNDHEYGAVRRIWERVARETGAVVRIATLPQKFGDAEEVIRALIKETTNRTKLVVVSHITSPTATILPVQMICDTFRARGIMVCVDGPHALLQVDLNIEELGCDFYTASCHKWLCAPLGSGFLYVREPLRAQIEPTIMSWGRVFAEDRRNWRDEFVWSGTRDPSAWLAIPNAIAFLKELGIEAIRAYGRRLASYARTNLVNQFGLEPLMPDSTDWQGMMAHVPIPNGDAKALQTAIWKRFHTEVPIIAFNGGRYVRVSSHAYNDVDQIDRLTEHLARLTSEE